MGMSTADLAIRVTSDTRKAQAGLDATTQKSSKLGRVGAAAGKALAAGLLLGAAAAVKLAQGAAEDQEAAARLANTLKRTTGATREQIAANEDWITTQGKLYGVADDQLRPALTSLAQATGSIRKAQQLSSIAMDISARRGLSLTAVSNKLAKAYATGNVAALAAYGVRVKDLDGKTRSLEAVTNDLAKTYKGSAAASAKTAAGQFQIAKVQASELGEEIGYRLIPALLKGAQAGLKLVDWIQRNQTTVAALVAVLGTLLAITYAVSKVTQVWTAAQALWSAGAKIYAFWTNAETAAVTRQSVATKAAAAAQWVLNAAMSANPITLVVLAIIALVAVFVIAYKRSETFRNIVSAALHSVAATAGAVVGFIREHWRAILIILTGPFGVAVVLIVKHWDRIKGAALAALGFIRAHWRAILVILTGPIGLAVVQIIKHYDRIKSGIDTVRARIGDAAATIKANLTAAFDAVSGPIQRAIDLVIRLYELIRNIPTPHLPNIPGLGRAGTSPAAPPTGGGTPPASGGGMVSVALGLTLDTDRLLKVQGAKARVFGSNRSVEVVLT